MVYSVLYVDSDEGLFRVVRAFLERSGEVKVEGVTSDTAALEMLASGDYDAVIAAHHISIMDGVGFQKAVRSRFGDLPFILFYGEISLTDIQEAVRNGAISLHLIPMTGKEFREVARELTIAIGRRKGEPGPQRVTVLDQDTIDNRAGITLVYDSEWHLLQWNRNLEVLTGFSSEELAGRYFQNWFPDIFQADAVRKCMNQVVARGETGMKASLITRSGQWIPGFFTVKRQQIGGTAYFTVTATGDGYLSGRIPALSRQAFLSPRAPPGAAGEDAVGKITGRPPGTIPAVPVPPPAAPESPPAAAADRLAREPQECGERFRVLAENVPNAVLLMDEGLRIRYATPRIMGWFWKDPHLQVTGKTLGELGLPEPVFRVWKDAVDGVLSSGRFREIEFCPSEGSGPACWTIAPLHGPDGSVSGVLAVDRWKMDLADVTSGSDTQKRIHLLNSINRHDILLQATVMAADLEMIRHLSGDPRIAAFCDRIRKAVDTICERVNASRFALDIVPREPLWQDVAAVLARLEVPDGIRLEAVLPLPVIFADIKLPVVFSSILRYTVKYSGGVSAIRISAMETTDGCVIRIEDNGTGIPEEEKKKIFTVSYSDHRDFDIGAAAWILSETHIGIRENGIPGKGIRFEITVPTAWFRFGPVPSSPGDPPAADDRKTG